MRIPLPKVNSSLHSTTPANVNKAVIVETQKVTTNIKPSALTRPKVALKSVGINKLLNPQINEKEEERKNVPLETKEFSEAELISVWKEYAEEFKQRDLDIYTTLTRHTPKLEDKHVVNLKLDNKAQEHELTELKLELLGYLRQKLNNYHIDIKTFIEKDNEEKGVYTPADKFKKLAQKNPLLEELKKKLDLDLGF